MFGKKKAPEANKRIGIDDFKAQTMDDSNEEHEDDFSEDEDMEQEVEPSPDDMEEQIKKLEQKKQQLLQRKEKKDKEKLIAKPLDPNQELSREEVKDLMIGHLDRAIQLLRFI